MTTIEKLMTKAGYKSKMSQSQRPGSGSYKNSKINKFRNRYLF